MTQELVTFGGDIEEDDIHVIDLEPTEKQALFIHSPCLETLFGGARGGGKTWSIIIDWLTHSDAWGKFARGIVVRPTLVELEDFIENAKDVLEAAGHTWQEQKKMFTSPKGAKLRCRYLETKADAQRYQGHAYTRVYFEEVGNYVNEDVYLLMLGTLRPPFAKGPRVDCRLKATANPGGPGHGWVKRRFVSPATPGTPFSQDSGKTFRVFIKSLLEDNPALMENDEGYENRLHLVGTRELVQAWRYGNWDIVVGQYFHEWNRDVHVIPTVSLPPWIRTRYRAHDWGSSKPACTLWFAVATGEPIAGIDVVPPRGALIVYREFYAWTGTPNVGLKLTAEEMGRRIREREVLGGDAPFIDENSVLNKIDPSCFATNGGPSIAEKMARAGAWFKRADNRRVTGQGPASGWDQVRARLRGAEYELKEDGSVDVKVPMLYIMDCCSNLIRTLPELQADPTNPDDVNSDMEDHPADTLRYGCMARPMNVDTETPKKPGLVRSLGTLTMDEAWLCGFQQADSNIIPR